MRVRVRGLPQLWLWLIVFCMTLAGHSWVWQTDNFTDDDLWEQRVLFLRSDLSNPNNFDQDHYSEHPGMPALLVAQAMVAQGMPVSEALGRSVALLSAIAVAGSVVLMRQLRPQSWWWVAGAGMLICHPFLANASPVDVVISYWLVMITLWLWWGYSDKYEQRSWLVILGGMAGVALATRLHVASIMLLLLGCFLARGRKQFWLVAGGGAVAWFIAFNPLLWYIPVDFGTAIVGQLGFFTGSALATGLGPSQLAITDFFLFAPFSLLTMTAVAMGWRWPQAQISLPGHMRSALFGMTIITSLLLLTASLQSRRYFFPLALIWEVLWPLVILEWWSYVQIRSQYAAIIRRMGMLFIVCLLVSANLYLLVVSIS